MDRVEHLTTQMKFRLNEGKGKDQSTAYYQIGVLDSGQVTGLKDHETYETLAVIYYMASTLDSKSHVSISKVRVGTNGFSCMIMVTSTTE
jgi:GTPase